MKRCVCVPLHIGSMAIRKGGARGRRSPTASASTTSRPRSSTHIKDPEADEPENRMNDGKVDSARALPRRLHVLRPRPRACRSRPASGAELRLYRLDPDLSVHQLERGIKCSNGPCWSPDNKTFYFVDLLRQGDVRLRLRHRDRLNVSNRRVFPTAHDYPGPSTARPSTPRAIIWNAHVLRRAAGRYAPDGTPRSDDRVPGAEPDQRHVRRQEPRRPLRHQHGAADQGRYRRTRREAGGLFAGSTALGVKGIAEPRGLQGEAANMLRQIRRIVTTNDADGKSGVMIDGLADNTITVLTELWITGARQGEPYRWHRPRRAVRPSWSRRKAAPCSAISRFRRNGVGASLRGREAQGQRRVVRRDERRAISSPTPPSTRRCTSRRPPTTSSCSPARSPWCWKKKSGPEAARLRNAAWHQPRLGQPRQGERPADGGAGSATAATRDRAEFAALPLLPPVTRRRAKALAQGRAAFDVHEPGARRA